MKRGHEKRPSESDTPLNRADLARILGIVLLLAAFLMLTFTPELLFEAWHRDGYQKTEAEILSAPEVRRSIKLRIASSAEEIRVRRTTFNGVSPHMRISVWYNPEAILTGGGTWLDTRVMTTERWPELPEFPQALTAALLNVLLGFGGSLLLFGRPRRQRHDKR